MLRIGRRLGAFRTVQVTVSNGVMLCLEHRNFFLSHKHFTADRAVRAFGPADRSVSRSNRLVDHFFMTLGYQNDLIPSQFDSCFSAVKVLAAVIAVEVLHIAVFSTADSLVCVFFHIGVRTLGNRGQQRNIVAVGIGYAAIRNILTDQNNIQNINHIVSVNISGTFIQRNVKAIRFGDAVIRDILHQGDNVQDLHFIVLVDIAGGIVDHLHATAYTVNCDGLLIGVNHLLCNNVDRQILSSICILCHLKG